MKIDLLPKRSRFLAAATDEVALLQQAQQLLSLNQPAPDDDIDLATAHLYQRLLQSEKTQLYRQLKTRPVKAAKTQQAVKLLIIPSFFYQEYPEVGGDGQLAQQIVNTHGFSSEVVPIKSRGSVTENKAIIRRVLDAQNHPNLWLLSISKGTADLRACLQEYTAADWPTNITGWINFSGIFSGSILADHRSNKAFKRGFLRTICRLTGVNYQLVEELQTSHHYWQQAMPFLSKISMLHVVGLPLRAHVQPMLAHRFAQLATQGPTDGMINLTATLDYPGQILPLWGHDHFIRGPQVSELLYQLCHHINHQSGELP